MGGRISRWMRGGRVTAAHQSRPMADGLIGVGRWPTGLSTSAWLARFGGPGSLSADYRCCALAYV